MSRASGRCNVVICKMSLFVGNLSPNVRHRELENAFRRFGRSNLELKDGYGFVVYEEHRDAERALRVLQGRLVCGERLSLSWARKHRSFQRFSGKGNSFKRGSWDKDQGQGVRRRHSAEPDRGFDDGDDNDDAKNPKVPVEVKDGARVIETRDDAVESYTVAGEESWKDQGVEKQVFEEDEKLEDPLDSGRWGEPLSEGSVEHVAVDYARDFEDVPDQKGKDDIEDSPLDKSHGSPPDKSLEHSSRPFQNSEDRFKRGRDAPEKPQERCFNCGHLGHVMRQCRLRLKMNMYHRDGFDGRRNQFRNPRGIGFRGMGGRFRAIDGPRRVFNRDLGGPNGRRNVRRRVSIGDRRLYEQAGNKSREKSRRRNHRSDRDSPSREGSKGKYKKSSKKTSHSTRKRRRSSSDSVSASHSHSRSSSSSQSRSHSRSSASKSQSSKSRSRSRSLSSSSRSRSCKSRSKSSRSRSASASSRSRSHSGTSNSGKSRSKSPSRSSKSQSRSPSPFHSPHHSPSPDSRRSLSESPAHADGDSLLSQHSHPERSVSPKFNGLQFKEVERADGVPSYAVSERQEIKDSKTAADVAMQGKTGFQYSSDDWDINEQSKKQQEWRGYGASDESKSWKDRARNDVDELYYQPEKLYNVGNRNPEKIREIAHADSINQESSMNKRFHGDNRQNEQNTAIPGHFTSLHVSSKGHEVEPASLPTAVVQDSIMSAYMSVFKEHNRGDERAGHSQETIPQSFGAARLWPLEAMLYRRFKRGPISTANYERRKVQNEEFGIEDKFVRSSSGWWEKESE